MPRNGTTGIFTRTDGTRTGTTVWTQAKNAAVKIVSGGHDTHDQDIATALNDCLTQDNKIKPTANFLPNADGTLDLGSSSVTWNNQYLKGNLNLVDGNNDGLRLYNGSNYVEIRSPSTLSASYTLRMPEDDGTAGQFLQTDGSGVCSWQTGSGAYNKISATSLSGSSTTISADGSTYQVFELVFDSINSNVGDTLRIQVSSDSGGSYQGTTGKTIIGNGSTVTSTNPTPVEFITTTSGAGNEGFGTVRIFTNGSGVSRQVRFMSNFVDSGLNVNIANGRFTNVTGFLTNIRILSGSGNSLTGTVRLYGISN